MFRKLRTDGLGVRAVLGRVTAWKARTKSKRLHFSCCRRTCHARALQTRKVERFVHDMSCGSWIVKSGQVHANTREDMTSKYRNCYDGVKPVLDDWPPTPPLLPQSNLSVTIALRAASEKRPRTLQQALPTTPPGMTPSMLSFSEHHRCQFLTWVWLPPSCLHAECKKVRPNQGRIGGRRMVFSERKRKGHELNS